MLPLLLAASVVAGSAAVAEPPAPDQARQRADALREQVGVLEHQVEVAAEDHATATEQLGTLISQEIAADADLGAARSAGAARRGEASRRVQALYMAGGGAGLMATVLTGRDLGDVLASVRTVQTLVAGDVVLVEDAGAAVAAAAASSAVLQGVRSQRQVLEQQARAAGARAQAALAQQEALLAETDTEIVRLALARRAAQEADALAGAAQSLVLLGARPGAAAPGPAAEAAIEVALSALGRPYQWGAGGPGTFDCSGLTSWAYRGAGRTIPRTSRAQFAALPRVELADLAPGDLVFWADGADAATIHHVGLYIGGGRMVHAPRAGDVVKVSALWPGIFGAVRPVAAG